eukprot:14742629-Alexandrium_andersonii.AAC.2
MASMSSLIARKSSAWMPRPVRGSKGAAAAPKAVGQCDLEEAVSRDRSANRSTALERTKPMARNKR